MGQLQQGGKLRQRAGLRLVTFVVDYYYHITFLQRHYPYQVLWVYSQPRQMPQHPEYLIFGCKDNYFMENRQKKLFPHRRTSQKVRETFCKQM
jgi:hypothetical protein